MPAVAHGPGHPGWHFHNCCRFFRDSAFGALILSYSTYNTFSISTSMYLSLCIFIYIYIYIVTKIYMCVLKESIEMSSAPYDAPTEMLLMSALHAHVPQITNLGFANCNSSWSRITHCHGQKDILFTIDTKGLSHWRGQSPSWAHELIFLFKHDLFFLFETYIFLLNENVFTIDP